MHIIKIIVKLQLQAFGQNFENWTMQSLVPVCKKSSPKLLNKILRYYIQIDHGYVLSKFVQMVAPPTLLAN